MIALILAAAALPTAVDAERAFARDAQRLGQWAAFQKYADRDAVMFTPQAAWARDYLKGRTNPPMALRWWPSVSFVSCDGRIAVNSGPWVAADGKKHGYFTTVWQREGRHWTWVYDGGDELDGKLPTVTPPTVRRAACRPRAPGAPVIPLQPLSAKQARNSPEDRGRGQSADKTLGWDWKVEKGGERHFRVYQWTGSRYAQVLYNDIKPQ